MKIHPFKALVPHMDMVSSVDSFFGTVKEDFKLYKKAGFFHKSDAPLMYVYIISNAEGSYRGVVAGNDLRDLEKNHILKHEKTLATKEQQMLSLTIERRAQIKPVLLAYKSRNAIENFIDEVIESRKPDISMYFEKEDAQHKLYAITDAAELAQLQKMFSKVDRAYVADGHHRCATSMHLHQYEADNHIDMHIDHLLVLYLPFDDLRIKDFNRIVDISENISPSRLMAYLSELCDIKPLEKRKKPKRKHEMTCCIDGEWYRLQWKDHVLKQEKSEVIFDTALLNKYVLNGLLKIEDVRSDPRIEYKSGIKSLQARCTPHQPNQHKIAFALYPIDKKDLIHVADKGETLPPKSTWFEPRVKNGVISIEL